MNESLFLTFESLSLFQKPFQAIAERINFCREVSERERERERVAKKTKKLRVMNFEVSFFLAV